MEKATKKYIKTAYQIINNNQFGKPTRKFNRRAMVSNLFIGLEAMRTGFKINSVTPELLKTFSRATLSRIKTSRLMAENLQIPF